MSGITCDIPANQFNPELKKSGRQARPEDSVISVGEVKVGGNEFIMMAGPCAVENEKQMISTAEKVHSFGARILRGGAFKPRTSPYSFQGLEEEGLKLLARARELTGMPVVTEVMDTRQVENVFGIADMFQVGSRNMQNFPLLKEVGRSSKPVLLKRGMSATLEEFLMAAEYIMKEGNENVILCERGIRTFETAYRNTMDLNAVPMLKSVSHLPVIVDPSHGTGYSWMVPALAKAALAVGADGLLIEVHIDPDSALCDGRQSLSPEMFGNLMKDLASMAPALGRKLSLTELSFA